MGTITTLLSKHRDGDPHALNVLISHVYDDLRSFAGRRVARLRRRGDIGATGVVNAACARVLTKPGFHAQNRNHFFFQLDRAIRDVVAEQVRADRAQKRGGRVRFQALDSAHAIAAEVSAELHDLSAALRELEAHDAPSAEIVRLRYFEDRSFRDAAKAMGCSFAVARGHWDYARAWLRERLGRGGDPASASTPHATTSLRTGSVH